MHLRKFCVPWLVAMLGLACSMGPLGFQPAAGRLDDAYAATFEEMKGDQEPLISLWTEAIQARERMAELMMVLGSEARRQAEQEMRTLERQQERLVERFERTVEREMRPYQLQFDRLQNRLWRLQNELDRLDAARAREQAEAIEELQREIAHVQGRLNTMQAMQRALDFNLPSGEDIARLPRGTDPQRTYRYLQQHAPHLLEHRLSLLDSLADLKRMREEKEAAGDAWDARQERQLERLLDNAKRARRNLAAQIERELRGDLRNQERLQQQMERLQGRLESASERQKDRLQQPLLELLRELEGMERHITRFQALLEFDRDLEPVFEMLAE